MKIVKYGLVMQASGMGKARECHEEFVKDVNEGIAKGWAPIGGVSIAVQKNIMGNGIIISQAMVKYEN